MVSYEWCVEVIDRESGDIVDNDFVSSFARAKSSLDEGDEYECKVVLVRTEGSEDDGVTDRLWAYLTDDGKLPEFFANASGNATGFRVPKKFIQEVAR
jgi:hypothetical protein